MTALEELTTVSNSLTNPNIDAWRAGGILPYRVRPTKCPPATHLADTYLSHLNCTFVRIFGVPHHSGGEAAAFPEGVAGYIDLAEQHVPYHICANNKTFIGLLLSGDLRLPKFILHPSVPCDSNMGTYPVMAEYFGCSR